MMKYLFASNHRHNGRHLEGGFTFIELMITMGLLGIFLVTLATIFTASIDVQTRTNSYSAVNSDGRFIMARLDYDIARASAIAAPSSLGSTSSSLSLTISGGTYTYTASGSTLLLTTPAGSGRLTSTGDTISNLSFTKLGNSGGLETIRYTFTLTGAGTGANANTQTFTSTAERRS